jgi:1,4-alpha-glucan branching enzyme
VWPLNVENKIHDIKEGVQPMVVLEKKKNEVTFIFNQNPKAKKVLLTGDFTQWNAAPIPMPKCKDGFKVKCKLPPGQHEYKFLVDGEWMDDPGTEQKHQNPFGTYNSVVSIEE